MEYTCHLQLACMQEHSSKMSNQISVEIMTCMASNNITN